MPGPDAMLEASRAAGFVRCWDGVERALLPTDRSAYASQYVQEYQDTTAALR
jgi:hypothetical protein